MTDDMLDTEDPLRGYRPAGPPPDLRVRIMQSVAPPRRIGWAWVPAFATAALIVLFYALNLGMRAGIEARLTVPDDLKPVEQWLAPGQEMP
jgi:hypothetical protein